MPWEIELDFATTHEDADGYWDFIEDTVTKNFVFHDLADAKAFFREAHEAVQSYQEGEVWDGDEWEPPEGVEEEQPPEPALDFVRKHNVTVFDIDGIPCGGYFEGVPVSGYQVALTGILRVVEYTDLTMEWGAEITTGGASPGSASV